MPEKFFCLFHGTRRGSRLECSHIWARHALDWAASTPVEIGRRNTGLGMNDGNWRRAVRSGSGSSTHPTLIPKPSITRRGEAPNLQKIRQDCARAAGISGLPKLTQIIAAVPDAYKSAALSLTLPPPVLPPTHRLLFLLQGCLPRAATQTPGTLAAARRDVMRNIPLISHSSAQEHPHPHAQSQAGPHSVRHRSRGRHVQAAQMSTHCNDGRCVCLLPWGSRLRL